MKKRPSSLAVTHTKHFAEYDPSTQKKISEEQAKISLFEFSNEICHELSQQHQHPTFTKTHSHLSHALTNKKSIKQNPDKQFTSFTRTQETSPDKQLSPQKLNQTFNIRKTATATTESSYRKKLLDIVQSLNISELQPKSCLNFSYYVLIDERPPKLERQREKQKLTSSRSYNIRRSKSKQQNIQKKILCLENNLLGVAPRFRKRHSLNQKHYNRFQKFLKF